MRRDGSTRWPLTLLAIIVVGVAVAVAVTLRLYPSVGNTATAATAVTHRPASSATNGGAHRTVYVAGDSGNPDLWTQDGLVFHLVPGDQVFAHRVGDVLMSSDGKVLLRVSQGGRVLLDPGGGPPEVEQGFYESSMGQ
jgi:hypothetical protein